jgi:hypothetical protein
LLALKCLTLQFCVVFRRLPELQREYTNQYLAKTITCLIDKSFPLSATRQHLECLEALISHFPSLCRPLTEKISNWLLSSAKASQVEYSLNRVKASLCLCAPKTELANRYSDIMLKSIGAIHQHLDYLLRSVDEGFYINYLYIYIFIINCRTVWRQTFAE